MEFRLLGPLELRAGDGPLPLGGEKQRALLALLLLNANHVVSRERLIDELWGEEPPETAVATVQVYVSRLRKLLPADALSTRAPGYVLAVGPGALDLDRFVELVSDARQAEPDRAAGLLREALALWRGPPLAEFVQEPFAQGEARRLEERRLAALEERVDADLALGRHAELIGELEALIAEHPHRERLRGQLMLALYRSGRQAEALEAYRAGRAALDELGIEPGASLRRLERQMLAQDASLDQQARLAPARLAVPGPLVPSSPFPFVGREQELADLGALLERAKGGEGALVLLTGEPGAGKTRLIREFAHRAVADGALVCYGASDAAVTIPYQPLRDWLEFLGRVCDREALAACAGEGSDVLGRLAPAFASVIDVQAAHHDEGSADRYTLQTAVADFLRRLGGLRPLLLVAEDIHWADGETLSLLARLARAVPEARVLVVASFRKPGEEIQPGLAGLVADLLRVDGTERLALGSLGGDDVRAFVHAATDLNASGELVTAIEELTDGTALLVCELWRELVSSGALTISESEVTLGRPRTDIPGPERIGELVEHRLSRLSPETGALVELAAVTGPRFELGVVAEAAGLDHAALTAAVEQAVRSGILEELPARVPAGRFTHELIRRSVYDRLSGVRRAELHLRVGEALERSHADGLDGLLPELAHHFTAAASLDGTERAVAYNLRAAAAAVASVAYREAATCFSTALELGIADPHERARVYAELGYLLYETGRIAEADASFAASFDVATTIGERGLAARALVQRSNERLASDPEVSSTDVVPIAEDAIETFEQLGDTLGLAMAEHLLAHALGREGRDSEAFAALDRALAHAEKAGDQVMGRHIIGRIGGRMYESPIRTGEAMERLAQLRTSSLNNPVLDACLQRVMAAMLSMTGRFDEALEAIRASDRVLEQAVETDFTLQSRWMVAEALICAGDLAGAEKRYVAAFLSMRDARGVASDARALKIAAELANFLCDQGRWDEAAAYLAYGGDVDGPMPVQGKAYSVYRFAVRGRLAARRGDCAEALELVRLAVEVASRGSWVVLMARVWLALAEVERACGHAEAADAARAEAIRLWEAKGNVVAAALARRSS